MKKLLLMSICLSAFLMNAQDTPTCQQLKDNYDEVQKNIAGLNKTMDMSLHKTRTLQNLQKQSKQLLEQMDENNCTF